MVDVAATPPLEELLSLLGESEAVRAEELSGSPNSAQFVTTRAALRVILGRLLEVAPREVPIGVGEHGKPLLTQGTFCFNISHTQGLILIAVREAGPIGIDVETTQRRLPRPSARRRMLAEAEARTLDELPPAEFRRAFFQAWSRKEAYAKGLGLGLGLDFRAIEVGWSGIAMIGEPPWGVRSLPLREPHVGAVAVPGSNWDVSVSAHSWRRWRKAGSPPRSGS